MLNSRKHVVSYIYIFILLHIKQIYAYHCASSENALKICVYISLQYVEVKLNEYINRRLRLKIIDLEKRKLKEWNCGIHHRLSLTWLQKEIHCVHLKLKKAASG